MFVYPGPDVNSCEQSSKYKVIALTDQKEKGGGGGGRR